MVHVNQEHPDRIVESPATVLSHRDWIILFVVMDGVNREHPDRAAEPPATVLCRQDWIMLFVSMDGVNQEHPDRVAEPPATVLSGTSWIHRMPFVVEGSAKVVSAMIIVVTVVTVNHRGFVTVIVGCQNVYVSNSISLYKCIFLKKFIR